MTAFVICGAVALTTLPVDDAGCVVGDMIIILQLHCCRYAAHNCPFLQWLQVCELGPCCRAPATQEDECSSTYCCACAMRTVLCSWLCLRTERLLSSNSLVFVRLYHSTGCNSEQRLQVVNQNQTHVLAAARHLPRTSNQGGKC